MNHALGLSKHTQNNAFGREHLEKIDFFFEKRPTILGSHFDYDDRYEESVE